MDILDKANHSISNRGRKGYIFEVDLEYPSNLWETHNDYPLAPEKMIVNGVEKLICHFKPRKNYVVHYRNLRQYLEMGMRITAVHRGISFYQSSWMEPYIRKNTELRKTAANSFEKDFFKLMNNSIFGKTIENIRKRQNIFIIDDQKYKDKAELLFTDTDSMIYQIHTDDFYKDISYDIQTKFDTSDYLPNHPSGIPTGVNKKVIGMFKDEVAGKQITCFVGLRPKLYSFRIEEDKEFNPSLKLDPDKKHQLALDRLSMTYSWYNIISDYKNNTIKYTHDGSTWQTITFTDGINAERNRFTKRQVTHRRNAANNADEAGLMIDDVEANYNKGFAIRKALLGDSATVRCEIPLNRYSFFESLQEKLLPNTKIELNIELESDNNLIWRAGGNNCRVILTRFQLFVPRLTFNSEGQKLYMENYLKPYKWVYLNEQVERSNNSQQQTGHFRITNAISKPRHVFVFGINTANIDSQTANPFLYNTFNLPNNANISRCYLEVGNGNEYPDIHFKPAKDPARVLREVMGYVYANNDFQGGTLLNRTNFGSLFPFVYFDLTKQKLDIKDGVTKLSFHYELSANPNADYNSYALILH
ncbi:unnamed protein product, partial [Porites evermanni]